MKSKHILILLFLFTLNSYSQDIILIKDSILSNYKRSGFCSENFTPIGKTMYAKREGFWQTYNMVDDYIYVTKDDKGRPISGTYWVYGEGEYRDGEKNGKWDFYVIEDLTFKKILYKQIHFKNGIAEGGYKYFHFNKKIALEGQYLKSNCEGKQNKYYDNGKIQGICFYKNNLRIGKWTFFYSNGTIESVTNYKMDKLDGVHRYYHENGQIWIEKIYDNGLLLNVIANYDSTGKKRDKGTLKDGNGTLNLYDENNTLKRIETYKDGLKTSEENF